MKNKQRGTTLIELMISIGVIGLVGAATAGSMQACSDAGGQDAQTTTTSGAKKVVAKVKTNAAGVTAEQQNITKRYALEKPGAIKHLYVISAWSGQAIIYSTVKGKVTSSAKRLSPTSVAASDGQYVDRAHQGIPVNVGGHTRFTGEVLQDDGTYGSSIPYVYWFDSNGRYHQHYIMGGQVLHISDYPLGLRSVTINMENPEDSEVPGPTGRVGTDLTGLRRVK